MQLAEFNEHLARILGKWPDSANWSVSMIAAYTTAEPDEVQKWCSYALEMPLEYQTTLDLSQGELCLKRLTEAHENDLHISDRLPGKVDVGAETKYKSLKTNLLKLASEKDWPRAYRNLSRFLGEFCDSLSLDSQVEALGDCIRYGTKAKESVGDLVLWLKKGVAVCAIDQGQEGVESALDFIEAYGDYFIANGNRQIVETQIEGLSNLIAKYQLEDHLREIREELGI